MYTQAPVEAAPEMATNVEGTGRSRRILSFLLVIWVGILSAEHFGSSEATGPLNPILLITYGPYYVVFAALLERSRSSGWLAVYLIGAVIGLGTETFITRQLWVGLPGAGLLEGVPRDVGGWAPFDTILLVCFWHPLMSAVVPLVLCRTFFGLPTTLVPLPPRAAIVLALILPAVPGLFSDPGSLFPFVAIPELLGLALIWWLLRRSGGPLPTVLGSLGIALAAVALIVAHGFFFFIIGSPSPERNGVPIGVNRWLPALLAGALLLGLILVQLRRRLPVPDQDPIRPGVRWIVAFAVYAALVEGGLTLLRVVLPFGDVLRVGAYLAWLPILGIFLGLARRRQTVRLRLRSHSST